MRLDQHAVGEAEWKPNIIVSGNGSLVDISSTYTYSHF
jgi:hypothetical protein